MVLRRHEFGTLAFAYREAINGRNTLVNETVLLAAARGAVRGVGAAIYQANEIGTMVGAHTYSRDKPGDQTTRAIRDALGGGVK